MLANAAKIQANESLSNLVLQILFSSLSLYSEKAFDDDF